MFVPTPVGTGIDCCFSQWSSVFSASCIGEGSELPATEMDLDLLKKEASPSSLHGSVLMNPTRIYENVALIPGLAQSVSSGVGCRRGWDPALLCLWCRPAAVAPIGPLAWEPPYAEGAALKKK